MFKMFAMGGANDQNVLHTIDLWKCGVVKQGSDVLLLKCPDGWSTFTLRAQPGTSIEDWVLFIQLGIDGAVDKNSNGRSESESETLAMKEGAIATDEGIAYTLMLYSDDHDGDAKVNLENPHEFRSWQNVTTTLDAQKATISSMVDSWHDAWVSLKHCLHLPIGTPSNLARSLRRCNIRK